LAISGAVMQTVTHNPLAEPYTIGISSAALFGVTISIALGMSVIPGLGKDAAIATNAFIFALIPALVIVLATTFRKLTPNMMVLIGIGMMYVFSAFTTLIKFNATEESLQEIYIWSIGTVGKIGWDELVPLSITAVLVIIGFYILSGRLNILMSGDKVCQSLGVNPFKLRIISFVLVSLGVAVCVCYSGTIGFVGLVAPHITRLFTGNNNKLLIPLSAISGALLILIGDIIVRMLPGGLPAGVITALIGSPLFLYFLFRQRANKNF
jgi:ABC-type Fe3+-siderophore transport system permease subunit